MKVKYSRYVVTLVLTAFTNLYLKSGDSDWRPGFSEGKIFPICSHFSINSDSDWRPGFSEGKIFPICSHFSSNSSSSPPPISTSSRATQTGGQDLVKVYYFLYVVTLVLTAAVCLHQPLPQVGRLRLEARI